ncbi:MAG: (2Fe-2S)-binding protein [Armatimonadota bacterium]|nr:(2Fe-2S)-binding protein [Armatimonadota bacterium]MDR7551349.1 (2Fe-2S)-binding protein [Armatimonadota bacterium]
MRIEFVLNGEPCSLEVAPHEWLLDVLRDRLGLTGTKRSCDVEVCGACTVLVDGRPVSACTYLAFEARGREVRTVEGLASGPQLHPLQEAFIRHGALQCGFCTPGFLMIASALLAAQPTPAEDEVRRWLHGNICRCTGYNRIIGAVLEAARATAATAGRSAP